jgi:hypothetical protein
MARSKKPEAPAELPFEYSFRNTKAGIVFEVWPTSGSWFPFVAAVPVAEAGKLRGVLAGPRGEFVGEGNVTTSGPLEEDGMYYEVIQHQIDAKVSAHVFLESLPSIIEFGNPEGQVYTFVRGDDPSGGAAAA